MKTWWHNVRSRVVREHTVLAGLILAYLVTGKLGLMMAYVHPAVTLVWAPTGIALGAVLVLGYRVWIGVLLGSALVYALALGPVPAVVAMAGGNTLQCILGGYLINRFGGGRHALQTPTNSFRFAGIAALTSATVSATIATTSLIVTGLAPLREYGWLWLNWTVGDLAGTLIVAPLVMLWLQGRKSRVKTGLWIEGAVIFVSVILIGLVVFCGVPASLRAYPFELLCVPVLLAAALRLGRRAASSATVILTTIAVYGTLNGYGPFARGTQNESLMMVLVFMGLTSVMTLALAALASEYAVAEAQLRELVVTDPLTGLPNHRRLVEVLSAEIARANRSDRGFAVVFFDMDGLKRINDEMGHLIGSRALCRFAETVRAVCRATDTPARYGGDEFVTVLPDTDEEGARLVIQRVNERLAEDNDKPQLASSAGLAIYPRDGGTPTTLLAAADRMLYAVKADKANARRRGVVPLREWSVGTR